MTQFNFGPIARTSAGGEHDTINLASFPLHVMLNALVGSTSVEEFIAWLWHDLYKPAFYWVRKGKLSWYHTPGLFPFDQAIQTFAQHTNIHEDLVRTHHFKTHHFTLGEDDFISDQADQVNLGATVNYIQLSLAVQPALPTLLTRSVITDSFIEVVTKDVAETLKQAFIDDGRVPIERVQFKFDIKTNLTFSSPPTNSEIWDKVGKHFDVYMDGNTFVMRHLTPVTASKYESFDTTFTADLTGKPLLPNEMLDNTVSLSELLVVYQDNRTVIIAVPQSQIYSDDLSKKIQKIQAMTLDRSRHRLEQDFNVLTQKDGVDYLKTAFDNQIEIREVLGHLGKRPPKNDMFRPLNDAVQRPAEMLSKIRNSSNKKVCRLTGTPFVSTLSPAPTMFSSKFVDTEFVGFEEDVAPLTHLYVINSPGSGPKTRKSLRGSFAFFAPTSHFAADDRELKAVEQPLLDIGGRFRNKLNRITVTTQEFTLFQQVSRRVIAKLWQQIAPDEHLPMPSLGAIALTHESNDRIRSLLPHLDQIFSDITLKTYPFESKVCPAIEVALTTNITPDRSAHQKHTLLKMTPHITTVMSESNIPILIDDNVQVSLTKAFFEREKLLTEVTNELKRSKKRVNQKNLWLKLVLSNNDPVTAVFESSAATINVGRLPKNSTLEDIAFKDAEDFWDRHIDKGDFTESWKQYEELKQDAANALEEFPALLLLLQALQKQKEVPQKQTKAEKNKTSAPQQLDLFPPQNADEI